MKYRELIEQERERLARTSAKMREASLSAIGDEAYEWKRAITKVNDAYADLFFLINRCSETRLNTTVA